MKIYCSNLSTALPQPEFVAAFPALKRYLGYVASRWGAWGGASLVLGPPPSADEWQIIILDDSPQAGALGFHDFSPTGKPIGKVFAATDKQYGYSWSVTFTHELAEMIADPYISTCMQTTNTRLYAVENGDPVEADALGFTITTAGAPPVLCSDFVLPGWFIPGHPGPYDYKGHCTAPLQVLAGGYAQYFESGTGWHQVGPTGAEMALEPSARFRDRG